MKIFAIRDESADVLTDLAYLFYYEAEKRFYIELPDDADYWETPMILSSFVKRGEKTVNSYWSKLWVQQRIVPMDRQNLGQILKDNNLKEYDEFELLMLSMGRCAQDDYYLEPISEAQLPAQIRQRFSKRVEEIIPLGEYNLLVFFKGGQVKKCRLKEYFQRVQEFRALLNKEEYFYSVNLQPGGYGVEWDVNMAVTDEWLYNAGESVPLSMEDFQNFISYRVVNVSEAANILGCTRQNIEYLTKTGKLHPVKSSEKNTLYLKSEILRRNWK